MWMEFGLEPAKFIPRLGPNFSKIGNPRCFPKPWRVIAGWTITAVVTCSKSIILITRIFKRRSHKNCVTSFVSVNNLEIPVIFGGSGKKKNGTKPQPEVLYKTESK